MQQASDQRARELEQLYQSRRGHAPQLSISDDNHHVTEAIGDMYGHDDDYSNSRRNSRPLSFVSSPLGDSIQPPLSPFDPFSSSAPPKSPLRTNSSDKASPPTSPPNGRRPTQGRPPSFGHGSPNGSLSPPLTRTNSDTASQQFPLNDLDYESSPAGLAQELSNLQAIRRMSMDVNGSDPDLPSFKSFSVPSVAPQHFSEDEDPSKLFWVPARLHPELSPTEFKTFIEDKVDKIRRRSGDSDSLSPDGSLSHSGSSGGLRRKKSMLSRQIDSGNGYRDGADRLERKRSETQPNGGLANLQELQEDPVGLMRRMSIDTAKRSSGSDGEPAAGEDMPILPGMIGGPGTLKRSTRTNYRRGSIRKGERIPLSRRAMTRQAETDTEESPLTSPVKEPELPNFGISRVQSEPVNTPFNTAENFSRPTRKRSPPGVQQRSGSSEEVPRPQSTEPARDERRPQPKQFHSRIASNGRTTAPLPGYTPQQQVPKIIETPPQEPSKKQPMVLPERHSSRGPPPSAQQQQPPPQQPSGPRQPPQSQSQPKTPGTRQNRHAQAAQNSPIKPAQSFDDLVQRPSAFPGNSTRTDNLSIIPNLGDEKEKEKDKEKKLEKKNKRDGAESGSRKTSWGWLLGSDDKEKERDKSDKKEKEEKDKETAKKVKNKLSKTPQEKSHDDTRLDVLQTATQGGRSRESVVLDRDRDSLKLEEERRKESSRKSSGGDVKKEKETGLFSSIFGGGKKKGEKEASHKKGTSMRGLSPEPPPRVLKPDIDYNWTRFSILEERAIYRMAHIKLANPRRELYSQVLLSNFMYSYLAKVQQMHPQIQIGTSRQAKQSQQRAAAAQQDKDQPEEFSQYQRYQQQQEQAEKGNSNQQDNSMSDSLYDEDPSQQRPNSRTGQYDQRSRDPRDSHHSQYGNTNGGGPGQGGYSVSNSSSYMGQQEKAGQNYYGFDDSDRSDRDDDMW